MTWATMSMAAPVYIAEITSSINELYTFVDDARSSFANLGDCFRVWGFTVSFCNLVQTLL